LHLEEEDKEEDINDEGNGIEEDKYWIKERESETYYINRAVKLGNNLMLVILKVPKLKR
jgi:hypothetical protein